MTEQSIFQSALELPDPDARTAFLDRVCADDPTLRRRIEELLAAHVVTATANQPPAESPVTEQFMQSFPNPNVIQSAANPNTSDLDATRTASDPVATADFPRTGVPTGRRPLFRVLDDRYVLGETLGEGGWGTVYRAEQTQPVRRVVAVKLIKAGMDSVRVVQRFEAERQALAVMDHPHIAKVLDAGTTPTGQPFFVMELVNGLPITNYCDAQRLTVRQRLELFVKVCQAVQHAHQKGVMHRDLKPGNILVTEVDGQPVPKVIDFGLAKALEAGAIPDGSLDTALGSILGTPLYMAPEQADASATDVDTRADVYALGVILYELMVGSTPVTRHTARQVALGEVLRLVREAETPPPTARLRSAADLPNIAAVRNTEPARLAREVRGELEWIALKCLEKDRGRRYETANGLAADVQRYLADEPVSAGPPSRWYKMRKFVRRHRAALAVTGSFAGLLVVAAAVSAWLAVRATTAERQAVADRNAAEIAREAEAEERQRAVAEAANAVAVIAFVRDDLLAAASPYHQFPMTTGLNRDLKVRSLLDLAARGLPGPLKETPLAEASVRYMIGRSYLTLGEFGPAQTHLDRAVELFRRVRGDGHSDTLRAVTDRAMLDLRQSKWEAARIGFDALLAAARLAPNPEAISHALMGQAEIAIGFRRLEEAAARLDEAQEVIRRHPEGDSLTQFSLDLLRAGLLITQRLYADAEKCATAAVTFARRSFGDDHPHTMEALNLLAIAVGRQGRHEAAAGHLELVAATATKLLGPTHPSTLTFRFNLGRAHQDAGRPDLAEPIFRDVLLKREQLYGRDHIEALGTTGYFAEVLLAREKYAEAEASYARIIPQYIRLRGESSPLVRMLRVGRAAGLIGLSRFAEAQQELEASLARGDGRAIDPVLTSRGRGLLGVSLAGQAQYGPAEPHLLAGYAGLKTRPQTDPEARREFVRILDSLVVVYTALGKPDEATKWRAERANYREVAPPPRSAK